MKKAIIFLSFFILQTILFAQTSVWEVKKDNEVIYLGGTIHLLRSQDYPLPKEFDKAYNHSDTIYFETDLQTLENPDIQNVMISSMKLEKGKKLSNILSSKTYEALNKHAKSRGINLAHFENFKPAMIILTLTVMELKNMGITSQGVDQYFLSKALKDGKSLGKLESIMRHISYMVSMGEGDEDNLITQSLKDFKQTKKYFEKIISAWKTGDINALNQLFISDMKQHTPKLYDTLLVERNNNWMPIIKSLFKNNETEFVLVGTAHLVGVDGLLQQLKNQGYEVKRYK